MNRRSSTITAWALVGAAGLSLFIPGDAPQSRTGHPAPGAEGARSGKSAQRSRFPRKTSQLSPEAAGAAIRDWLKSPANRATPPLDAIRALSATAVEEFLRDPQHGWHPLLDPKPPEGMAHLYEFRKSWIPFHRALLERWAEVDFQSAVAKVPPPKNYDEDVNLSWVIFTTAAKTDPAMAFQALQDWHRTTQRLTPFAGASHDVMQIWSAVDPDSSWQWLASWPWSASTPPDEDIWKATALGYLKGLGDPDWEELLEKAETLPAGEANKTNPRVSMRLEMIRVWGYDDPLAALASFDGQSADPVRNPYPGYAADPQRARWENFAILVESWMAADPGVIAKLQSWKPEDFDTDGVFKFIALNGRWPYPMRQQARDLIRDPKVGADADASMEFMEKSPMLQFCGPAHQGWSDGQK